MMAHTKSTQNYVHKTTLTDKHFRDQVSHAKDAIGSKPKGRAGIRHAPQFGDRSKVVWFSRPVQKRAEVLLEMKAS